MVINLSQQHSLISNWVAELRDVNIQGDRMRFRRNLERIAEAIDRIEKYAAKGRKSFEKDELIQNWIVRHLQIIGEAVRALSDEYRKKHSDFEWLEKSVDAQKRRASWSPWHHGAYKPQESVLNLCPWH